MEELCHILNENIKKTIVIGDYYNDLEIMKKAGLFLWLQATCRPK